MGTFITRLPHAEASIRLAVKDLIDVAGVPTTAGCRAVAETAVPAVADAPCMAGARAARAAIVGKTNLYELAFGASGVNDWFGTPVNPLDPGLVPGGSSSGSAVAVADGDADVAYGTDTGGSVRIPAAFCGVTGLKTTHGRVPLAGVWPLAPSLDTVGPMARDVAGTAAGMALLEPGFEVSAAPLDRIGRIRPAGPAVDPRLDAAVDEALSRSGLRVTDMDLAGWDKAFDVGNVIIDVAAAEVNSVLLAEPAARARLGAEVRRRLDKAAKRAAGEIGHAQDYQRQWRASLLDLLATAGLLALPTVAIFPPRLADAPNQPYTGYTMPVNVAGLPALALPVPSEHRLPGSLQLIGPPGSEALLLATGAVIEAAAGYQRTSAR